MRQNPGWVPEGNMGWNGRRGMAAVMVAILLTWTGCGSTVEKELEGKEWMAPEGLWENSVIGTWPVEKEALVCKCDDEVFSGHDFQKVYWPSEPTCLEGGDYNLICNRCGYNRGAGSEGALPHRPRIREEMHGDCIHLTVEVSDCEICGLELARRSFLGDEHDYQEVCCEEFNVAALQWEQRNYVKCSRCGAVQ